MTSIREQIYQVAATDTALNVGVLALLTDGLAGLKGGEASTPPSPGNQNAPWAYLGLVATVPKFPASSRLGPVGVLAGGHQWWLYDDEQAGYARLRPLGVRLMQLYGPYYGDARWNTVRWVDAATGERVHGLEVPFLSNETADPETGQLMLIATFPWVLSYSVQSVA